MQIRVAYNYVIFDEKQKLRNFWQKPKSLWFRFKRKKLTNSVLEINSQYSSKILTCITCIADRCKLATTM